MNLADFHLLWEPVTGPAGRKRLEILHGWRPEMIPKVSPPFELCDLPGEGQKGSCTCRPPCPAEHTAPPAPLPRNQGPMRAHGSKARRHMGSANT